MVEARRLVRRFGPVVAVDDVTFTVPAGSIAGILGPNGAGKTTTIRMLVGALEPTSGSVSIAGTDMRSSPLAARRNLGYLPEHNALHPELRVSELLRYRGRLHGLHGGRLAQAVGEAIERCQLGDVRRRLVGALSKGYRQRVGLAAALLHQPPVVILDEPTSGLDPNQIAEFRALIRGLRGRQTVLLSSHVLAEIDALCDRLLMVRGGRVVADGAVEEIRRRTGGGPRLLVEVGAGSSAGSGLGSGAGSGTGSGLGSGPGSGPGSDAAAIRQALEAAAPGHEVRPLSVQGRFHRMEILCRDADDAALRERVGRECAARSLILRELATRQPSLEELFATIAGPSSDAVRTASAGAVAA